VFSKKLPFFKATFLVVGKNLRQRKSHDQKTPIIKNHVAAMGLGEKFKY